jgi:peptidyl-prolyl cis-trans isomerase C
MGKMIRVGALAGAATVGLALVAFAQPAVPVARPAPEVRKVVTVVNGVEITAAQLEAVLKAQGPMPLHLPEGQRRQRQSEALSTLVDSLLMQQFLDKHAPRVPPAEVDRRLAEMEAGLRDQSKSLAEYCNDTNQTLEQLKQNVADHLRWHLYVRPLATDDKVERYYRENRDFFEGTMVRASHIVVRLASKASSEEKEKARARLEEAREKLLSPGPDRLDFAEAARKYSDDPRARFAGGDLGYIPRKWMYDEEFARAAFSLPKGQVSGVVRTEYGLHVIQVTDRRPGRAFDFAANKERVREMYMEEMRDQVLREQRRAWLATRNGPPQLP